jgi:hypothetical protein
MTVRGADVWRVAALATLLTVVIAAPVLRAPSERIFGMAIVGRHYDPFTVMEQFSQPVRWTASLQPITDVPGALLSRLIGAVAAYNVIVLLSFPLTAVAAYLLARHCGLSSLSAVAAAFLIAFSPFHIAQAAYHPHVAQVQWLPLYLLMLWRCLDRAGWTAIAGLVAAIAGVTFANFYGGLIASMITPVAVAAYWLFRMRGEPAATRCLALTSATLAGAAVAVTAYAWYAADEILRGGTAAGFAARDVVKYGAMWSSYLVPPVAHPWLGELAHGPRSISGAQPGLLEQQLSLGYGVMGLSAFAVVAWMRHPRARPGLAAVPVLTVVALFAMICSLSLDAPSAWLHERLPMFRAYARFGAVVQVMAALLAALGGQWLWRTHPRARIAVVTLVMLVAFEYAVWPPTLWRDVLPTAAHRWVARQPAEIRVLDCYPNTQESQSVQWLTGGRVTLRPRSVGDCREPGVISTLSAHGFTHLLVRRHTPEGDWFDASRAPTRLGAAIPFDDAVVVAVTEAPSVIRTTGAQEFFAAEFNDEWTWRWMGAQASWTVVNTTARALLATVEVETNAFHQSRQVVVLLNGIPVQQLLIEPRRATRRIGPLALWPGDHTVTFRALAAPSVADDLIRNGDRRALSVAFGDWRWTIDGAPQ